MCLTLSDGKNISFQIDMKVFQELRRCLTYHIKKIIDNDNVNLLK